MSRPLARSRTGIRLGPVGLNPVLGRESRETFWDLSGLNEYPRQTIRELVLSPPVGEYGSMVVSPSLKGLDINVTS